MSGIRESPQAPSPGCESTLRVLQGDGAWGSERREETRDERDDEGSHKEDEDGGFFYSWPPARLLSSLASVR